jgi:N-acetylglutamate synthase-like GNAT family acetyltransferase
MIVRPPQTPEEFERYRDLRWRILRAPWNQPKGTELDELEKSAFPIMVCEEDGIPIGVGRVHFNSEDEAQIRSMAVEEEWRGKGIGAIVLKALEQIAIEKGAKKIILHARDHAVKFYEKNGYTIVKPSHTLFEVIPHYLMEKKAP